jgi:uncharacterized protein YjbI with pentapeptide repeats
MASFTEPIRIRTKSELLNLEKTPFTRYGSRRMGYNLEGADLEGADLEGADLKDADLKDANLKDANLKDANLKDANLEGAKLARANLEGAHLRGANLEGANLEGANLEVANLRHANLRHANLADANLADANLGFVILVGANLADAILVDANLEDALLEGANLRNANLRNANLEDADLPRANLEGADLTGADLLRTNLEGADLTGANLENANLIGARLTGANLEGAFLEGANFEFANLTGADDTPPAGVAYEVHRKSHELESNEKFLNTIGANESPRLASFNYNEIQTKFVNFINDENNFKNSDKKKLIENFTMVINRAKSCETLTSDKANMLNKSIVFAFQQDSPFTEAYIDIFIDETFKAYSSGTDQLSCVAGIKERFYTSLLAAALQVDTIEGFVKTPKLITLLCMAKTGKVQKDPNEILQKWAESWEGKDDEWKKMQNEERKEHFKNYMMEEYKKDDCYEENQESIKNTINAKATEIDYVFQNNEEAAQFGGRKRKNKRSLKKRGKPMKNKTKTKTKRVTRKAKQNKKKRITRKAKQSKKKRSVRK